MTLFSRELLNVLLINILTYLNDLKFVIFANLTFEISSFAVFSWSILCLDIFQYVNVTYLLITKKGFRDFKIASLIHFFCWLHFQYDVLIDLTMCAHFSIMHHFANALSCFFTSIIFWRDEERRFFRLRLRLRLILKNDFINMCWLQWINHWWKHKARSRVDHVTELLNS
jgi:hypothetical protein